MEGVAQMLSPCFPCFVAIIGAPVLTTYLVLVLFNTGSQGTIKQHANTAALLRWLLECASLNLLGLAHSVPLGFPLLVVTAVWCLELPFMFLRCVDMAIHIHLAGAE